MLKALLVIAVVLVVCVVALLAYAATKPDTFTIQRSATIKAPPERVFALINDFTSWRKWSPWEEIDPDLERNYSGAPSGKGAIYEWDGKKAGAGRMEIMDAPAPQKVTIKLDFIAPFKANNMAEFRLEPQDGVTTVTWAVSGPQPYMAKLMSTFCDMDEMIGKDFEAGLVDLKRAAEAGA